MKNNILSNIEPTVYSNVELPVKVTIINLKQRMDRKENTILQFKGKREFSYNILEVSRERNGAMGLWKNIKKIVAASKMNKDKFVIVCEDDHVFTKHYSANKFLDHINKVETLRGDILLGGVSWSESAVPINDSLYWIEHFGGTQFMVIFSRFYKEILSVDFNEKDNADAKISKLTRKKYVIHPFISKQKDFGYSDVTFKNNQKGSVEKLFYKSSKSIENINKVQKYYLKNYPNRKTISAIEFSITTYIIDSIKPKVEEKSTLNDFANKSEFDTKIIKLNDISPSDKLMWEAIKVVSKDAIKNDEDVIIITNANQRFSNIYSRKFLLENILDSHTQGTDILLGNLSYFSQAVPIAKNRFWIDRFFGFNFMVIFKKFFSIISNANYKETIPLDLFISSLTSNKLVFFPFISRCILKSSPNFETQKEDLINVSLTRLKTIHRLYTKYNKKPNIP